MRDLKQCLIDLLRSGGISVGDQQNANATPTSKVQHKPKKLHEYTAADCNAAFLRKYYDVGSAEGGGGGSGGVGGVANYPTNKNGIIYFNENLSMTSKYDMRQYHLNRFPPCPLSTFSHSDDSISPQSSKSDRNNHTDIDSESGRFEYSSSSDDDRATLINCYGRRHDHDDDDELDNVDAQLDSFCTLCTSSFSYNKCCRYCDNSHCGSQCNSVDGSQMSASLKIQKYPGAPATIQRNNLDLR